jgi:antitoxin component YwqK of YwqJK toxin-antitoxin module
MGNSIKYIVTVLTIFIVSVAFGQQKSIAFKNDTIRIEQWDSIYYRIGNDFKGELKYGHWGYCTILKIDSGFVINRKHYFATGKLQSDHNYKNGRLHGDHKEWNENEILIERGHYNNGYEDSIWTFYYENGVKETEGAFIVDTLRLIKKFIMLKNRIDVSTGDIKTLWTMKDQHSPPHGEWNFYDKKGKRIKTLVFDKGVIVSIEVGDYIDE